MNRWKLLIPILMLALLIVACGPAVDNSVAGEAAAAANDAANDNDAATAPAGLEVRAGSEDTTASGIPVGFTADGYPFLGDPNAPVIMEEFSDFQCPYCYRFHTETLPSLLENQIANGELTLVFYDFPLTNIHPQANTAHLAARCAAEEGAIAFWNMHDALFNNLAEWNGQGNAADLFAGYARELGLDMEAYTSCMASNRYADAVVAATNVGVDQGINSTPSFLLNGSLLAGAQPLQVFNDAISQVMSGEALAANDPAGAQPQAPLAAPTPATISNDYAASLGDPNAKVTIVEYTDYQCPFCQRHVAQTFPQLLSQMIETGRVQYILKDFPLESIHPEARRAALAARCAGEQDAYWEMHASLFGSQQQWSGQGSQADTVFAALAQDLGLDLGDFNQCLSENRYDSDIQGNLNEGAQLGVRGTPAFFINGYPITGAQPYDLFDYAIGLAEEGTLAEAYTQEPQEAQPTAAPSGPQDVPLDNAIYSIGDPNAPVVIVEYTDFQCPYCSRHFQQTFPQILSNFVETGQVRYVFKDFPLVSIHPQAVAASEAARCANDQDAYLAMHDTLFARQGEWSGRSNVTEIFTGFAAELNLDTDAFAECLTSNKYEAAVMADLEEGSQLGVRGTPAFFINGYLLSGAQPYSVFEQAINDLSAQ